jgi:hypothetical protein
MLVKVVASGGCAGVARGKPAHVRVVSRSGPLCVVSAQLQAVLVAMLGEAVTSGAVKCPSYAGGQPGWAGRGWRVCQMGVTQLTRCQLDRGVCTAQTG